MKKTFIIFVSVLLLITLFVPLEESKKYAAESSMDGYKIIEQNDIISRIEIINIPSTGVATSLSRTDKNDLIIKARNDLKKETSKDNFVYNTISPGKTPKYVSTNSSKATTSKAPITTVTIKHTTTFDEKNKQIIISTTIKKLTGKKPVIILTGNRLYASNKYRDGYSKVKGYDVEWTGANIKVGKTKRVTYKVKSTKFWTSRGSTTVGVGGSVPISSSSQLDRPVLTNKNAVIYPKIYDSHSKRYMGTPIVANMKTVMKENRVKWTSSERNKYKKAYIEKFSKPKFRWEGKYTEIHHIIPREYGGTNAFGNLFPLPTKLHRLLLNPWWKAY